MSAEGTPSLPALAREAPPGGSPLFAGARTAWHSHSRGQFLHVTEGSGLVHDRDGQTIAMRPGDTVYTPPVVWHWHGAMPDHFMTYLALADGEHDPSVADVDWGDLVLDSEYDTAVFVAMSGAEADGQ